MVLGLGKGSSISKRAGNLLESTEESGQSLAESGFFPTVLTFDQLEGPLADGDITPDTGRWVTLAYYQVGAQEEFVIGSKARESDKIGKINMRFEATGGNSGTSGEIPSKMRVRAGYETANGRASYPVFNYPAERLYNEDVEQRINQAPKRWAYMRDDARNGVAQHEDIIFINAYLAESYTLDSSTAQVQLPGMLSEE